MSRSLPCPCGRGLPYDACCGRYHAGGEPPDVESLMRSRYAAFVKKDVDYLVRTLHADHEDRAKGEAALRAALKRHFTAGLAYRRLEVLDVEGEGPDGLARVLFVARIAHRGKDASFAELSTFAYDGVGWRYLAGRTLPATEVPEGTTIAALEGRSGSRPG